MSGEDGPERLAVPVLLECPHREERGHLVVPVRGRDQQVAQVADRVMLDVVHVLDATNRVGVERLALELGEVDAVECDRRRPALVGVDVEGHAQFSSHVSPRMTSGTDPTGVTPGI